MFRKTERTPCARTRRRLAFAEQFIIANLAAKDPANAERALANIERRAGGR